MAGPLKLAAQAVAVAGVGLLATLLVWKLTHQTPAPKVGKAAPVFSLQRLTGDGDVSLRSLRGKTVVLNFFASWCGPCKREAPVLERLWRQERAQGLVVLGVDANDSRGDGRHFVQAHELTYPVVFDQDGRIDLFAKDDALHSIANYLRGHGWSGTMPKSSQQKVIFAYNRSFVYANTVLAVADRLKEKGRPKSRLG